MSNSPSVTIMGIDPGYERIGVSVIEKQASTHTLLYSDCITTSKHDPHPKRLQILSDEVKGLIEQYSPSIFAIETLFFNSNQKTAFKVSEARGALLYIAESCKLTIEEYTPLQIKMAVTGYGKSDKKQITKMIPHLISIEKDIRFDDEYDAIAAALTASAWYRNPRR